MDEQKTPSEEVLDAKTQEQTTSEAPTGGADSSNAITQQETLIPSGATSLNIVEKKRKKFPKKTLIIILAIVGLLLIGGGIFAWSVLRNNNNSPKSTSQTPKVTLMGAELSIVDGPVQQSTDKQLWKDAKVGDQITEGAYVRAQASGRAVIALDDGSAIRINSSSIVKINSLDTTNVVITNESGDIYTRLVPSERQFSVNVGNETYVSLGTAYVTINKPDVKGVEVYESKVKLAKANLEVAEGKLYYHEATNASQLKKLADISIDKIKADSFLAWNYDQDKKNEEFKNKLGYLVKIDEPAPKPEETAQETSKPVTQTSNTNGISLSGAAYDKGVKLTWKLTGLSAQKGFKVVRSLSANPTYGTDDAVYVSGASTRSYTWSIKDGKTYNFRVCIYTDGKCTNYSNNITVTAPLYTEPAPSGTLSLSSTGGNNFSWVLSGSAPNGFKLVWSTSPSPTYPANNAQYYGSDARAGSISPDASGTYYVRVCMYKSGSCVNYSNELPVTYTKPD